MSYDARPSGCGIARTTPEGFGRWFGSRAEVEELHPVGVRHIIQLPDSA
ncbi:hypothetical protein IU431_13470 [Nocardia otitidiscaviarum]|nr:hypothetical protein [Nocardia otitidiscaviarum]MBF6485148.1 hypothetical protein [Nocardia otitidiscaviarum]